MTANVSEDDVNAPAASAGAEVAPQGQASPQPVVSALPQHDYSNIQQPAPMMAQQGNAAAATATQVRCHRIVCLRKPLFPHD